MTLWGHTLVNSVNLFASLLAIIASITVIWYNSSSITNMGSHFITSPNRFRNERQFLEFLMELKSEVISNLYKLKTEYLVEHFIYLLTYTIVKYASPLITIVIYFGLSRYADAISYYFPWVLFALAFCLILPGPISGRRGVGVTAMENTLWDKEGLTFNKSEKEVFSTIREYQKWRTNLLLIFAILITVSEFLLAMIAIIVIKGVEFPLGPASFILDILGAFFVALMYFSWALIVYLARTTDSHINEYFLEKTSTKVEVKVLANLGKRIFSMRGKLTGIYHNRITIKNKDDFVVSVRFKQIESISVKDD